MSSRYTTGLQNVGSYQVSGRPWLKNHAFTGVESKFYEFPNVTDYIKVANGGANNLDIAFCEPRRSVNMANHPSNEHLSTSITAAQEVTLSMWVKFETLASTPGDVRLANFTVTILGEVRNPGTFTIQDERITILEALGLADDLTIFGKRKNVLLVREVDGKKKYAKIDLTTVNVVNSPVYYLQQNDVIYVEPNNAKIRSSTYNQNNSVLISAIGTLTTIVAVFLVK